MTGGSDRIRLDQLLVQRGLAGSREKAKAMIMAGMVRLEGERADKPGLSVSASCSVYVKERLPYVSRGGLKLEAGLARFSIDVSGLALLDVGASTGGFTDCLLQRGAHRVVAVDVGYGQLDWTLRQDPRVEVMERTNIRSLTPGEISGPLHGAVIDVSFISLRLVIPCVSPLLDDHAFVVALIKPQFEVGRGHVGKGGVVRDPVQHREVIKTLEDFFKERGWTVKGSMASPIPGPKGNREFLVHLIR